MVTIVYLILFLEGPMWRIAIIMMSKFIVNVTLSQSFDPWRENMTQNITWLENMTWKHEALWNFYFTESTKTCVKHIGLNCVLEFPAKQEEIVFASNKDNCWGRWEFFFTVLVHWQVFTRSSQHGSYST